MAKILLATLVISQLAVLSVVTFVTLDFPSEIVTDSWTNKERASYLIVSVMLWLISFVVAVILKDYKIK